MKYYGTTRSLGWSMRQYSFVTGESFERLQILGTRKSTFINNMANGGHQLLGLQFSSHLSDFMPSCVRATHNGDAKECSSKNPTSEVPQMSPADHQPAAVSSSTRPGLLSFASLRSRFGTANDTFLADVSGLDQHTESSSSMAASGSAPEIMMDSYEVSARAAKNLKEDASMDNGQEHQFYFASSTMFPDQTESGEQHDQADDEQTDQNNNNNKVEHQGGSRLMMETLPLPHSMWVPSFNFSNSDVEMMSRVDNVANDHHPITLESPPSCAGEDIYCGVLSKDHQVTDNTYTHTAHSYSHGFRSKISRILSLEKRGTLVTSPHILGRGNSCAKNDNISNRRASMAAESRVFESNKGSCFGAHRFVDCCGEVNKNVFHGECSGRSSASGAWGYGDAHGSRPDVPWMDSTESGGGGWCNPSSGDSHWHSEQRNVLMRTLHKMRCDIESLKMMLRALENPVARNFPFDPHGPETLGYPSSLHPLMMSGNTPAASKMKQGFCPPLTGDGLCENRLNDPKADNEVAAQNASDYKDPQVNYNNDNNNNNNNNDKDLMSSEEQPASGKDSDDADNSGPNYQRKSTHGGAKKQKQWWRELLTALGLTVWVLAGAALVAKVIGVPNLGVTNIAHNKSWGSSDDESNSNSVKGSTGVIELNSYTFNDVIKKRTTFVMFYAPWCPHCQRLHPIWSQLASVLARKQENIQMAIVDATRHSRLADKYDVPGFPTLILFKNGVPVGRHRGARDLDTLLAFIASNT